MPIKVTIRKDRLDSLARDIRADAEAVAERFAESAALAMKRKITSGPRSGRVYASGPKPLPHQASAPGEPPANWTGELAESIEADGKQVLVKAAHAALLEFGGTRMAPRPYFFSTLEEEFPRFIEAMRELYGRR